MKLLKIFITVSALLITAFSAPVAVSSRAGTAPAIKITVMFPASLNLPNVTAFQIAKYKGYYAAAGLDVEFLAGKGGAYAAREVGLGHADFADVFGDTEIVVRSEGLPIKMVALMGARGPTVLTMRSDSGIHSLSDLKGKQISILGFEDSTYYVLQAALASVRLTKEDVGIQALGAPGVLQQFIEGKVQVCACIPEWIVAAEDAHLKLNFLPVSDYVPSLGPSIVTSDRMIAERPDVVRRFVGATLKAYDELRTHPEQMAKVYAKAVPEYRGRELTLQRVYYYYSKFAWTGQRVAGRIDPDRLNALQISYYDQKIIPRKSPLTDLFTDDFVNDALPIGRKP